MLDKLSSELFFQQKSIDLLNRRQNILASNIANADTPGYLARDLDFSKQLKNAVSREQGHQESLSLTLTSGKHISAQAPAMRMNEGSLLYRVPDQPSADGNTVDMDRERVSFVDNSIKYQSSIAILNSQIKNMLSVISQG